MVFILYKKDTSPPCRSVQMVLHELGIYDVELIEVNLPEREHLKEEFLRASSKTSVMSTIAHIIKKELSYRSDLSNLHRILSLSILLKADRH